MQTGDQTGRAAIVGMPRHIAGLATLALLLALAAPVTPLRAEELVGDPDFSAGNADGRWWATENVELTARPGAICAAVAAGTSRPWDAIIGLNNIPIDRGETYRFAVSVESETGGPMRAYVQEGQAPWTPVAELIRNLPVGPLEASRDFTADASHRNGQIVFQLGGSPDAWTFCLKRVSLQSGVAAAPVDAEAASGDAAIRINQAGYLPDGPKIATLVSDSPTPLDWALLDSSDATVATGRTRPRGFDRASGLDVHIADFSAFRGHGAGFRLKVGDRASYAFPIGSGIYDGLAVDALSYFYPVRSGIAIDGAVAGAAYARPAGHAGTPPNRGDTEVSCVDGRQARVIYGEAYDCDYRLDVSGGWYDAGDFGKYVVNGGIAVAQLMGAYERALNATSGASPATKDGYLRIPESGNGIPDILDEARWELDFLISMMVPDGEPLAGMAHHKVHGEAWGAGPLWPHQDPVRRVLHRPSTAATLNLAAAAAQGARLFRPFDAAYADRLLGVAIKAYRAAEAHPALFAPLTDGSHGGGDYQDDDVSDEFYWAAAELYLTTGVAEWHERLKASPHWNGRVFSAAGFNWRSVAALGRLQLAAVPSELPEEERADIEASVRAAADMLLATQNGEGFGLMYDPDSGYGWGSNHSVIENMVVAAVAYDVSGNRTYLNGVRESMDYILGRNALGISYVTGHGTRYARRQFSMMFAHAVDPAFPEPPRGALAGGPNSQPADPVAEGELAGCAWQACYIDAYGSYSTNEIAVNWNAALGWISVFLADTAEPATSN